MKWLALLLATTACSLESDPTAGVEQAASDGQCMLVSGRFQASWGERISVNLTCLSIAGTATLTGSYHVTYVAPYEGSCNLCCCGSQGEPVEAALDNREQ